MQSKADIQEPELIHSYVDATALRCPDHIACEYLDESLSYAQLAARTSQLAQTLVNLGVGSGDRVGIYMPKSIDTPVALFGIMKSGAAYVPLDPSAPIDRIRTLCQDCGIRIMVSSPIQRRPLKRLSKEPGPITHIIGVSDELAGPWQSVSWDEVARESEFAPAVAIEPEDLAYIIYTSGSTGVPKGMMHTHRSGLCFSRWAASEYGFNSSDRLSNHAPLHFDLSIMDYFSAVVAGATTVIVPEEHTKLAASYSQLIADKKITVLYTVPFALIQLLLRGALEQRDFSNLRYAIFGGEPFPTVHLRAIMQALPHVKFDNIYGPAEVNGVSHHTLHELPGDIDSVPIGTIAQHAQALVVDAQDCPVDDGEVGELLVSSPSMMRGYWQREDLTSRALFQVDGKDSVTYYRTGDMVERMPDGLMRFVGRKDRQVKIRGYRVELDEVELALAALDEVEEGAAYVVETSVASREIRAEVTVNTSDTGTSRLMRELKQLLPSYALPAQLVVRSEFPRTATGKIDRRTLQLNTQAQIDCSVSIGKEV